MEGNIQVEVLYRCVENKAGWTCMIKSTEWNYNKVYCTPEITSQYLVNDALFFYVLLVHLKFPSCLCRLSWIHNDVTWIIWARSNCRGMPLQPGELYFLMLLRRLVLAIINNNKNDGDTANPHILQLGLRRWDVFESGSELDWGSPAGWLWRSSLVSGAWATGPVFGTVGDRADPAGRGLS